VRGFGIFQFYRWQPAISARDTPQQGEPETLRRFDLQQCLLSITEKFKMFAGRCESGQASQDDLQRFSQVGRGGLVPEIVPDRIVAKWRLQRLGRPPAIFFKRFTAFGLQSRRVCRW